MNRRLFAAAALAAAAGVTVPAAAQTAADAFECKLPYKAAMQSMASLTVLRQKAGSPATSFMGELSSVEFVPASIKVLGAVPSKLIVSILSPTTKPGDKRFSATIAAYFPRNASNETTLNAAGWTRACKEGVPVCGRDGVAQKAMGSITYMRDDPKELSITCSYNLTTDDLE